MNQSFTSLKNGQRFYFTRLAQAGPWYKRGESGISRSLFGEEIVVSNRMEDGVEVLKTGKLFVISGPSGVGKDYLVSRLLAADKSLQTSISATTRPPRPGEQDGVHYYFQTTESFNQLVADDQMLEYAQYGDYFYGTPKNEIEPKLASAQDVVRIVEVAGAQSIKQKLGPAAVLIFIRPPSRKDLEERLRGRGTEDENQIQKRLFIAQNEMAASTEYDYVITNDNAQVALTILNAIIAAERDSP